MHTFICEFRMLEWWTGTVRLVLSDLFREDAIGNFVLGLEQLFIDAGILCKIYAERSGADTHIAGTYSDFFAEVEEKDLLFYQLSNIDKSFDRIVSVPCKKLFYYHNITPGYFFEPYDEALAMRLDQGREQFSKLHRVDGMLANSQFSLKEVIPFLREGAYANSVPPVTASVLSRLSFSSANSESFPIESPFLLMLGRLVPHKSYDDAFLLMDILRNDYPDMHLYCVGAQYSPYVQKLKKKTESAKYIHLTGQIPSTRLQSFFSHAQGLLCMSDHEGFCVPVLEAMGLGVPVFAHSQDAVKELLGGQGCLLEKHNLVESSQRIVEILKSPSKKDALCAGQKQRFTDVMKRADGQRILYAVAQVVNG